MKRMCNEGEFEVTAQKLSGQKGVNNENPHVFVAARSPV
jgi:hypothetical protein